MPDRRTETIDGVEHFACQTCGLMKPRSAYHTGMTVTGAPPPHCKVCARKRISVRGNEKTRRAKRRGKLAAAEVPPPPPELEVPPDRVAQGKRLACPHCHETALREPANGRPGFTAWLVTCAYCDQLNQLVEVAADGTARSIPRRAVDEPGSRTEMAQPGSGGYSNSAVFRPYCKVKGCGARAEEYGLCSPHLSRCRMAKRLDDIDAWVAQIAPPPPAPAAPKAVKHKPKVTKKKAPRPAACPCHVIDCERPANHLGKQLCKACYESWRRRRKAGEPIGFEAFLAEPVAQRRPGRKPGAARCKSPGPCVAEGCQTRSSCSQRLCPAHRMRWVSADRPDLEAWLAAGAPTAMVWRRMVAEAESESGDATEPAPARADECEVAGCHRSAECLVGGRLCRACHSRWGRRGEPDLVGFVLIPPPRAHLQAMAKPCRVPDCPRTAKYRAGLCNLHGGRWCRAGKPAIEGWLLAGGPTARAWATMQEAAAAESEEVSA